MYIFPILIMDEVELKFLKFLQTEAGLPILERLARLTIIYLEPATE